VRHLAGASNHSREAELAPRQEQRHVDQLIDLERRAATPRIDGQDARR